MRESIEFFSIGKYKFKMHLEEHYSNIFSSYYIFQKSNSKWTRVYHCYEHHKPHKIIEDFWKAQKPNMELKIMCKKCLCYRKLTEIVNCNCSKSWCKRHCWDWHRQDHPTHVDNTSLRE